MRYLFLIFISLINLVSGQETTFPVNGADDYRTGTYAFVHATIFIDYKTKLTDATLLIEKGKVMDVGIGIAIPKHAIVENMNGLYI